MKIINVGPILFNTIERLSTVEDRTRWVTVGYDRYGDGKVEHAKSTNNHAKQKKETIAGIEYKGKFFTTHFGITLGDKAIVDDYDHKKAEKELKKLCQS